MIELQRNFSRRARTKIVATIGPSCSAEETLAELVAAGVDVFRLNMAHASPDEHAESIARIRRVSERLDEPVAILADLPGPKIRLGEIAHGMIECFREAEFTFVRGEQPTSETELTCTYTRLIDELSLGDTVRIADGTVSMEVVEKAVDFARCKVVDPGIIRNRQGVNLPGVRLSVPTLGKADIRLATWAAEQGVDFVSLSFVRSADDVRQLKELLRAYESEAMVIAKIEKSEALENLEAIVQAADGVMVARGDLGVEIDVATMPLAQKRIINMCRQYQRPVIIATQMLESMHTSTRPTRAEATDVANAILDGADACMLSGETAIGQYPVEAVSMMNRIALATEGEVTPTTKFSTKDFSVRGLHPVTQSVVRGAGEIARWLDAKLVVVASHSGATAQAISGLRGQVPVIGVSSVETTLRRMCLFWGVTPLRGLPAEDVQKLIDRADQWGIANGLLTEGDLLVTVGGSHLSQGMHDVVAVHRVGTGEE